MKIMIVRIAIVLSVVLAGAPGAQAGGGSGGTAPHVVVDNHIHYLNFVQQTDGFPSLVLAMDKAGVEKAVVFGMPLVKMWTGARAQGESPDHLHLGARRHLPAGGRANLAH